MKQTAKDLRAVLMATSLLATSLVLAQSGYEPSPVLDASDVLPSQVLRSGHHQIREDVTLSGELYEFYLDSDYGAYRLESEAMLRNRVHEVRTLAQAVSQFQRQDGRFAAAVRRRLEISGGDSWVDIVKDPVETSPGLSGQFSRNIGDTIDAIRGLVQDEEPRAKEKVAGEFAGAQKRNVAIQLDLDAFSTNPRVQAFLDAVVEARVRGNLNAGVATISLPPSQLARVAGGELDRGIGSRINRSDPTELNAYVAELLSAMRVDRQQQDRFFDQPYFSPRHRLALAQHLDFLQGVDGRGALVGASLAAESEVEALLYELTARMLAVYHERDGGLRELRNIAGLLGATTASGALIVVHPVDHIYWSASAASRYRALARDTKAMGYGSAELVISGTVSNRARAELSSLGVRVREQFMRTDA